MSSKNMITINSKVPEFELAAYHKDEEIKLHLTDYRGQWLVVIFYPADFTFVCPTELEEAAEHYKEFKKIGAEIVSVSTDKVETHKAWHDVSPAIAKVQYPMIADPTGKLCREFGVYLEDEGMALRGTFIIDPKGLVKTIQINHNDIGRSTKELLRTLKACIFVDKHPGKVCPASWEEGEEVLKPGLDLVGKI